MIDHQQIERNKAMAGLPYFISEGKYAGRLTLLSNGRHALDFFGGDGKVRRMTAIPFQVRTPRRYQRRNGRVVTVRPTVS